MKLVRNPSYKHSKEKVEVFNRLKDSIYMKDHSRYEEDFFDVLVSSVIEGKKKGLKKNHLLWLTKQIWDNKVNSEKVMKEDYLSLVVFHSMNENVLAPISKYENFSELNDAINDLGDLEDSGSEKDYGIIYEEGGWFVAMPHTKKASCLLGKGTSWCTARTKGDNMFLEYVGDARTSIVLFYVIKVDGNPKTNPNDKISVGFSRGYPIFDGKDGGLTVNADNKGIRREQFENILGEELGDLFLKKMREKMSEIKYAHPIKKELEKIASSSKLFNQKAKELKQDASMESELLSFYLVMSTYPINEMIQDILISEGLNSILESLAENPVLSEGNQKEIANMVTGKSGFDMRKQLAKNKSIAPSVQMRLLEKDTWAVINEIAANENICEEAQLFIIDGIDKQKADWNNWSGIYLSSQEQDHKIRDSWKKLAANTSITDNAQKLLLTKNDRLANGFLSENPSITEEAQLELALNPSVQTRINLAQNRVITEKTQISIIKSVTKYPNANDDMYEGEIVILRQLSRNTSITKKVYEMLLKFNDEIILENLKNNPKVKSFI